VSALPPKVRGGLIGPSNDEDEMRLDGSRDVEFTVILVVVTLSPLYSHKARRCVLSYILHPTGSNRPHRSNEAPAAVHCMSCPNEIN
jgi:hypothetical protein